MANKINIAEILKDCPKCTKLYSPVCGEVELSQICDDCYKYPIIVKTAVGDPLSFSKDGRLYIQYFSAECLLFPSSEMRDWRRFFKRGDIVYGCQEISIFESWADTSYTTFNRTLHCDSEDLIFDYFKEGLESNDSSCCLASDKIRTKFIAAAEKYYHGKYNPDTLQVEQVESVKPECPFKPFDKVLVRDDENNIWYANYFSHYREDEDYPYVCIDSSYRYCIPYEGNEHLLGTTDTYTEGGSE